MNKVFTFLVKGNRSQEEVAMEAIGMYESDAKLSLEQQLKKDGFLFKEIIPSEQLVG